MTLQEPLEELRQGGHAVPGAKTAGEAEHRTIAVDPPADRDFRVGRPRVEARGVDAVHHHVDPLRVDPETGGVLAQRLRDREHGVRSRQRPALGASGQLAEARGPVGGLLLGDGRVELDEQRHVEQLREHGTDRGVELVPEDPAELAGERARGVDALLEGLDRQHRLIGGRGQRERHHRDLQLGRRLPGRLAQQRARQHDRVARAREGAD